MNLHTKIADIMREKFTKHKFSYESDVTNLESLHSVGLSSSGIVIGCPASVVVIVRIVVCICCSSCD